MSSLRAFDASEISMCLLILDQRQPVYGANTPLQRFGLKSHPGEEALTPFQTGTLCLPAAYSN